MEDLEKIIEELELFKPLIPYKEPSEVWALGRTWKYPEELKECLKAYRYKELKRDFTPS